jgi:hypothetical protein
MITVGLSQHEINLITKILDKYQAHYHVDAIGGSTNNIKARGGRGDTSFYQIEIPQTEFEKLPASAKSELENLGIYPELEAPSFEFENSEVFKPSSATVVRNKFKRMERILIMVFLIMMSFGFIYRVLN